MATDKKLSELADAGPWSASDRIYVVQSGAGHQMVAPRERLTADRTYFYRTDGSDDNTGLVDSAGGAFASLQAAYDAAQLIDPNGYAITLQAGPGPWTVTNWLPAIGGPNAVLISGNTSSLIAIADSGSGLYAYDAQIAIQGFKLIGCPLVADLMSVIWITGKMDFGANLGGYHTAAFGSGHIHVQADYIISGGADVHHYASGTGSTIDGAGQTVTLTGTPAIGTFAVADNLGLVAVRGFTYSGTATGNRDFANLNGVIYTAGGGASYFPGNATVSPANGGQRA